MSMGGNPHYGIASSRLQEAPEPRSRTAEQIHFTLDALTQAALALAYEQQTANLIAFLDGASAPLPPGDGPAELYASIVARLGLNGGTK